MRITNILKIIEFRTNTKILKIITKSNNNEQNDNLRIPLENHKHYENQRIATYN